MNNAPLPLWQQAADFALELMETLAGVLPTGDLGLELTAEVNNATYQLTTADPHGIELRVDDKPAFRFEIDYRLVTNTRGDWLKVQRSSFAVVPDGTGAPFFRYDFDVDARSVPRAHLNVHGHRDDMIEALLGGTSSRSKSRRQRYLKEGRLPRLSNFHFPLGGQRMRPCIEDVLEVVASELNIDVRADFEQVLQNGRERYRRKQLQAAVRDSPSAAAEALASLGYDVTMPANPAVDHSEWLRLV
ncbi:hypothetical protein F8O06_00520 [Pseudoclavibacter sp. CFCC 14310]|uniref:hypothetical protein n=1 Tax=Pseudoclavibacter sp. CFCC 14310 TaxID=2615180 RepID=UPI00139C984B|nr:hypothetical protein [Pseudoclavibacter sp. CFCC 14310]KAB1647103.1 hypothetical protein F8O06_00520 [Pseudoclavibacter sp. CFCC 14310]